MMIFHRFKLLTSCGFLSIYFFPIYDIPDELFPVYFFSMCLVVPATIPHLTQTNICIQS